MKICHNTLVVPSVSVGMWIIVCALFYYSRRVKQQQIIDYAFSAYRA